MFSHPPLITHSDFVFQDGFVIKTSIKSADGMKAFINICRSDVINKATSIDSKKKVNEKK